MLLAKGTPSLEKIQLNINDTKAVVHGGLYDFIRDAKVYRKNLPKPTPTRSVSRISVIETNATDDNADGSTTDDIYERISPIIPKVCLFFRRFRLRHDLIYYFDWL